jgi:uncharacterized protein (TIGR02646 family)
MRPVYRGTVPARLTLGGRRAQTTIYDYHAAGGELLRRVGEYCAYCESALCGNAAIEHMVSKTKADDLALSWDNFLPTCVNCNSRKGSKVTKDDYLTYLWPCQVAVDVFSCYQYVLANGVVTVAPAGTLSTAQALSVQRTIDLVQLNNVPDVNDEQGSDRRAANRTQAWVLATELADRYLTVRAAGPARAIVGLLERQISDASVATGYWSVWMTVFRAAVATVLAPLDVTLFLHRLFCLPIPGTYWGPGRVAVPTGYTGLPAVKK